MLTLDIQTTLTQSGSGTAGTRLRDVAGTLARFLVPRMDERRSLKSLRVGQNHSAEQAARERSNPHGVSKGILLVLLIIGSLITVSAGPSA